MNVISQIMQEYINITSNLYYQDEIKNLTAIDKALKALRKKWNTLTKNDKNINLFFNGRDELIINLSKRGIKKETNHAN